MFIGIREETLWKGLSGIKLCDHWMRKWGSVFSNQKLDGCMVKRDVERVVRKCAVRNKVCTAA